MDIISAIVAASAVVVGIAIAFWVRLTAKSRETQAALEHGVDRLEGYLASQAGKVSLADEKKETIRRMGPKTFYYLDQSQVKDLYLQIFQQPEAKRI